MRRQKADQQRTHTHQQQGADERGFAADAVAQIAEEEPSYWPGDEADREGGKGKDSAEEGIDRGKEDLGEDEGSCGSVKEEIVPLNRGADRTGDHRLHERAVLCS